MVLPASKAAWWGRKEVARGLLSGKYSVKNRVRTLVKWADEETARRHGEWIEERTKDKEEQQDDRDQRRSEE